MSTHCVICSWRMRYALFERSPGLIECTGPQAVTSISQCIYQQAYSCHLQAPPATPPTPLSLTSPHLLSSWFYDELGRFNWGGRIAPHLIEAHWRIVCHVSGWTKSIIIIIIKLLKHHFDSNHFDEWVNYVSKRDENYWNLCFLLVIKVITS